MASKDEIIAELRSLVEKQVKQITALAEQIAVLSKELDEVKLQLARIALQIVKRLSPEQVDALAKGWASHLSLVKTKSWGTEGTLSPT